MEIKIMKNILDRNQELASSVRELLVQKRLPMVNMISSPGAGKTTLLERICEALGEKSRIGIIEGDITTDRDAQRLKKFNIPIVVINTEGGCHLDSHSISKVLDNFELDKLDVLIVENVGNLICPSHFDLGETFKMAVVSVPEGDDKPGKYPMAFRESEAVILNKTDLIPYTNFSLARFEQDLRKINSNVPLFKISCMTGDGVDEFLNWLTGRINGYQSAGRVPE